MALRRDGEVTVVGTYDAIDPTTFALRYEIAVARFTPSGAVDARLGGGTVLTSVGGIRMRRRRC